MNVTNKTDIKSPNSRSDDKFKELFNESPLGIVYYDTKGDVIDANETALEIIGIPELEDIFGNNLFDNPYIADRKEELHKNGSIKFQAPLDLDIMETLGFYKPTRKGIIYLDYMVSGTDSGYLVQIQDITESKKMLENLELKVKSRTRELEEAISELKRYSEDLEQFAYVASHDLQEPLRTITSFTQLLERRYKNKLDSDADEFINFIVDDAKRMKAQIEDLLEYSRVTIKEKEFEPLDLNDILKFTLQSLEILIKESNAEIIHEKLPVVVGDAKQLQRVFQNLILNAIKFRKCEIPLKIHVSANKEENNNEYIFKIKDNGIGIEKQYLELIFVIFQRLHTRDVYKGTGIGLSIVKRIVERHGGQIWVKSEFGKGSTFCFSLPA